MAKIHRLVVGRLQTNCYILESESTAFVIDPGDEPERILRFLRDIKVKPSQIIATHAHFDHVLASMRFVKHSKFRLSSIMTICPCLSPCRVVSASSWV